MDRRQFMTRAMAVGATGFALGNAGLMAAWAEANPEKLAHDPERPQFHLLSPANWMNDPNGPLYWNHRYHMFYQYNPNGAFWGDMHWGHAVSPDMVHWKHLPIALSPTPGGPDAGGCFSGSAVIQDGVATFLYTGAVSVPPKQATNRDGVHSFRETQCLATSKDPDLRTWSKMKNPVIATPPPGLNETGFRDPSPWRQGNWWYMAVGSGIRHKYGCVLLYRSKDLRHWEYLHPVAHGANKKASTPNPVDSGDMWECPDLFPLNGKHVLIYSTEGNVHWESGELDPKEMLFHPQRSGIVDHGSYYAAKTQLDAEGNRIQWGWIPETRPLEQYRAAGWAGVMSLPRVLTLAADGQLQVRVSPAVDVLRQKPQIANISSSEEQNRRQIAAMHIEQCCGEIRCNFKRNAERVGLSVIGDADGHAATWLKLEYDPARPSQMLIDDKAIPLHSENAAGLDIQLYIDGSVIELFLNKEISYTKRFYYPGPSAPRAGIRITGKTTSLSYLSAGQITPISNNRLTM